MNSSRSPDQIAVLFQDMEAQRFDLIRYPMYRVASKLRFIQKKTNLHLIDVWNVVESIRENGLDSSHDVSNTISVSELRTLISSIYHQLSKRFTPSHSLNLDDSIMLLTSFVSLISDRANSSELSVLSAKVILTVLCSGKMEDKMTYFFSLVSDPSSGLLILSKFNAFVQELAAVAQVLGEGEYYNSDPQQVSMIFDLNQQVGLKDFLQAFVSLALAEVVGENKNGKKDQPRASMILDMNQQVGQKDYQVFASPKGTPFCFSYLMAMSRMAEAERTVHPIACKGCHRNGFTGLRYKCQKCFNYNLCQECFWRGHNSGSHNPDTHPCKEFCFWQSQSKEFFNSLRRSFRRSPSKTRPVIPKNEDADKKVDSKSSVPPSPIPGIHLTHNRVVPEPFVRASPAYASLPRISLSDQLQSTPILRSEPPPGAGDEHQLIAMYAKQLAEKRFDESPRGMADPATAEKQRKIKQLEDMTKEIASLKELIPSKACEVYDPRSGMEPAYASELVALKLRKEELERHLNALQDSRKELLVQLESLMKLLKNHGNLITSAPSSAASTLKRGARQDSGENFHYNSSDRRGYQFNGSHSMARTLMSQIKGLNSDDEATFDELGLDWSRRLKMADGPAHLSGSEL